MVASIEILSLVCYNLSLSLCLFCLVLDTLDASTNGILVSEVSSLKRRKGTLLRNGFQIIVEFVNQRSSGGDVQVTDFALVNVVQVLDQSTEGVSVGSNQNSLSILELRSNVGFPERNNTVQCGGQGLGELIGPFGIGVSLVVARVVFRVAVNSGWGDIVGSTPDENLVLSVLVDGLLLVQSLESSVVTFVDLPRLGDGDPHTVGLLQNVPQGADGTLLKRGEGNIGLDSGLGNELSSLGGFDVSSLTQWAIIPTGELVGKVPGGLSVSDQNQGVLVGLLGGGETKKDKKERNRLKKDNC